MELLGILGAVLVALILISVIKAMVGDWFQRVTVMEYQRALLYRKGRFAEVLSPGVYWIFLPNSSITCVDVRSKVQSILGQEVLSSDGISLKVSLGVKFQIEKPVEATHQVENHETALYQALQNALREVVGGMPVDDLLAKRGEMAARLLQMGTGPAAEMGLKLEAVTIKDLMFPGDLKKVFAQVVQARKEGQAALEKARGETAALRNLANAARMMENHPALLQLRALQHLGGTTGNTLVMGVPPAKAAVGKKLRGKAGGQSAAAAAPVPPEPAGGG